MCWFQLIVMDLHTKQMAQIPSLPSTEESFVAECPCGIHAIATNPSNTLLATGAKNTNDLAIYKLPTFDPVCVGEVSLHVYSMCVLLFVTLSVESGIFKMAYWPSGNITCPWAS